jgi:hypothetical protein
MRSVAALSVRGLVSVVCLAVSTAAIAADEFLPVAGVEPQPLVAATSRLVDALDFIGSPLSREEKAAIIAAGRLTDAGECGKAIQAVLDPHCIAGVTINPESRVSVVPGPAPRELVQQGWRTFLVKVHNQAGINPELKLESPNVAPLYRGSTGSPRPKIDISPSDVRDRWLDASFFTNNPLQKRLSGLALEYRVLQLYSRDAGQREATLGFNVGQGTQDLGFRNETPVLFKCLSAISVKVNVADVDGRPTTASFVIRDRLGRVYPNPARRLAPDFFFHNQVYRNDGEHILLPPGEYTVEVTRGPEYRTVTQSLTVTPEPAEQSLSVKLQRWIHLAARGWFSGDHHVHAAGCAHYENPTEGVTPEDMLRHIVGEDLNVGCVLSWGPCWYMQKQFFEGKVSALSRPGYLMRYDVEVSGFPSSHAGHLCLLRLTEDDYDGTSDIEQWPSWTLPVLQWGRRQGGVVGYSHSGWGLALPDYDNRGARRVEVGKGKAAYKLPDDEMPPFDGIGANEYIVTTALGACDFISAVDTPIIWELNIWYHTLNCGMTSRISGETDFPCIYGDKVGLGRIYVKLPTDQPIEYDAWVLGLKDGRSYCCDGLCHLIDFRVNGLDVGFPGTNGEASRIDLAGPESVRVTCDVAALLAEKPTPQTEAIRNARLDHKPYWHVERCRIGDSRQVLVELVVNGEAVASKPVTADGSVESVSFEARIEKSSWVAMRVLGAAHTNPVFVHVAGKPIRARKASADWCIRAVDQCWKRKSPGIRESERAAAKEAYDQARAIYEQILKESP